MHKYQILLSLEFLSTRLSSRTCLERVVGISFWTLSEIKYTQGVDIIYSVIMAHFAVWVIDGRVKIIL